MIQRTWCLVRGTQNPIRGLCPVNEAPTYARMNKHRRFLVSLLASLSITCAPFAISFAQAQGFTAESTGVTVAGHQAGYDVNAVSNCSRQAGGCIPTIIGNVISGLLGIFGALFLILIMWGGVQWMFAGGEPAKVKAAQATLSNAILGMLVVAASYAIVNFVLNTVSTATSGVGAVSQPTP
jgi:hypothetical protein